MRAGKEMNWNKDQFIIANFGTVQAGVKIGKERNM
jgi:hypothetical protein